MTTRMGRMATRIWGRRIAAAAVAVGLMAAVAAPAFADEWHGHGDRDWHHHWHRGWYGPHYVYEPYYYAPPPVVYAPPPPPPAYYYSPPPVVYAPPVAPSLNVIVPLHFR